MQTKQLKAITNGLAFTIIACVVFYDCQKDTTNNQKSQSSNPTPENIITSAGEAVPPYNLNVVMQDGNGVLGFVKFRQKPDTARIINLDTWLFNLKPNHPYLLQRAVNPITDPTECSSTAWLTLGLGLTPQAIHTDKWGFGFKPLYRDITAIPRGTEFYIHFQVIDSLTSETVLTSPCLQYMVR
jgi:hypothetical protein